MSGIIRTMRSFFREESGAIAIILALALPMMIGAAGVAIDIAQAYNVRSRLADALDKAALAGGSTLGTEDQVEQRVLDFFAANYKDEKLGTPHDISVTVGEDYTLTVSAWAQVQTTFMAIFGDSYDTLDIYVETKVKRELAGVEAVLVLDVTGSMAGSKIASLKTASTSFINIMFDNITDTEFLKIGIVPYSASVNVGPYGLGKNPDDSYYGPAFVDKPGSDPYVSPASNIDYGTGTNDWRGCILERSSPQDVTDDAPLPNWGMYRYVSCGWQYIYGSGWQWVCSGPPNRDCPTTSVVPLTNSQSTLLNAISGLSTGGYTYTNVGAAWGYHLITPTEPFTEGVPLDDDEWSRTIIIMTDGDNNTNNTYSAYGSNPGLNDSDLDDKLVDVCTNIKNDNIQIYTITFGSGVGSSTQNLMRECASEDTKYYHSSSGDDLEDAFENIASQLSQLHIVK
ncbi:MAG: VWA domain-containing protein [Alphaproteobacteria bacterium]|nr:VWA domain-containing protein [Alphaproteobacteria bacterium]